VKPLWWSPWGLIDLLGAAVEAVAGRMMRDPEEWCWGLSVVAGTTAWIGLWLCALPCFVAALMLAVWGDS
jgi:hypothetical protein